ncbi:Glutaredoxin-like domain [Streptomyces sp. 2112.3]|nr:glutaredoxin-like protein DUF836 [Streptomyces sp. 2321.6]SDR43547.1 Glutaredoxin-like domain [Streptomyces sp. KS_16]SEC91806.1 Glutaredoxin-like domain [Streptomyces sp. 2133.1]SEE81331.1 Glutaredoxin-like domain [Streptomyces sp. 2112.3]SNC69382.1 Glutaredoxin-like domain [Streptomyces sp. 2114.4]
MAGGQGREARGQSPWGRPGRHARRYGTPARPPVRPTPSHSHYGSTPTHPRTATRHNGSMAPLFNSFSRSSRKNPADRMVTLIGKPGCHLCDDAQAVIEKVCAETGAAWEKKDITEDADLHRKYWEQIPVILVDGAQHDFWRVDPKRLRTALGA